MEIKLTLLNAKQQQINKKSNKMSIHPASLQEKFVLKEKITSYQIIATYQAENLLAAKRIQ